MTTCLAGGEVCRLSQVRGQVPFAVSTVRRPGKGCFVSEKKTRRRGVELDRAILDAAWLELRELGWTRFTIEGVSARSRVAKTVIYRRWRNRADLVQHMLNDEAANQPELESSGDLRTDLVTLLTSICEFLRGPFGQAIRGAVSDAESAASPTVFGDEVVIARLQGLVDESVARGELSSGPGPLAMNLGHAVMLWEFIATGAPPAPDGVERFVDTVWLPTLRHGV